jgi:copper chaperone
MLNLTVPDMSCGHCVKAITAAVQALDVQAIVETDLVSKKVTIDTAADTKAVIAAMTAAGYPPA